MPDQGVLAIVDVIVIALVVIGAAAVGAAVAFFGNRSRRPSVTAPVKTPEAAATSTEAATGGGPVSVGAAAADGSAQPESTPADGPPALPPDEVFALLYELALGARGNYAELPPAQTAIISAVAAALETAATQDRYAPRRPSMLPRLLSATNDEDVSLRDLTPIITQDPSLVGALLKIANSSFYRVTPEPVESVDRAVILLGTVGIRSMITAALMQPIFRVTGNSFPHFPQIIWEHTFRAASAAVPHNVLAEGDSDPYAAELLALVMGLAAIVIFRVAIDEYQRRPGLVPDAAVIAWLLHNECAGVAWRIGASWELSPATLAGLQAQRPGTDVPPTSLSRSVTFGRLAAALAVLQLNKVIDERTALASMPASPLPPPQIEQLWARLLTAPAGK